MKVQSSWMNALFHSAWLSHEYDPVKAREYYLRTRELKGRAEASGDPESVKRADKAAADAEARGDDVEAQRQVLQEALQAQLEQMEVRMEQLQAAVKAGKLAAMRRSGASEETLSRMISQEVKEPGSTKGGTEVAEKKGAAGGGSSTPEAGSESEDAKPKTASQKSKDAKAAKERYEEEKAKNPEPDQAITDLQTKVDEAGEKIQKLLERIEAMNRLGEKPA